MWIELINAGNLHKCTINLDNVLTYEPFGDWTAIWFLAQHHNDHAVFRIKYEDFTTLLTKAGQRLLSIEEGE